jgi:hypothetical protein
MFADLPHLWLLCSEVAPRPGVNGRNVGDGFWSTLVKVTFSGFEYWLHHPLLR